MTIYVFGNPDDKIDSLSYRVAKKISRLYPQINFIPVLPGPELPFSSDENVILMDVILNLKNPALITDDHIPDLTLPPRFSAHDFDLGFQLKILKKIHQIGTVTIIGIPPHLKIDYLSIHSIFKKLVAQDMHGS